MESVRRLISKDRKPYQLLNGCSWRKAAVEVCMLEFARSRWLDLAKLIGAPRMLFATHSHLAPERDANK
jgi:hypothetical protein